MGTCGLPRVPILATGSQSLTHLQIGCGDGPMATTLLPTLFKNGDWLSLSPCLCAGVLRNCMSDRKPPRFSLTAVAALVHSGQLLDTGRRSSALTGSGPSGRGAGRRET